MKSAASDPRSTFIRPNGVLQHFQSWGAAGPDLIIIPGITMPAPTWGFVAKRLARRMQVHVVDVRGRGLSDHTPGLSYQLADLADDVIAVANRFERPILLGHSMGARIAVAAAATGRCDFRRVIVVDPPLSGPGRRPYPTPLSTYLNAIREVSEGGGEHSIRRALPSWSEQHIRLRAMWLPSCSEEAVAETYKSFHQESLHCLLPAVNQPTSLIYAEFGDVVRDDEAAEFVRLLPVGGSTKILGAGHMIPWDRFAQFIQEVESVALRPPHVR